MNTTVYIVWAMQNTDATLGSPTLGPRHDGSGTNMRGISPRQYNLITEAMAAAITPTTTIMMMPSTSVVSTPQPTGNDGCQYRALDSETTTSTRFSHY